MRSIRSIPLLSELYNSAIIYSTPSNLTYFWNFGIYALICLVIQILTGIFLAMHYTPESSLAFLSVEHIMRDVNYGWLLRYIHANGASMFFIVVYIHTFRGFYYSSFAFPREGLWAVGVVILLLMILTAFLGYVLPWGQMSFWAATVITNLVSAIPKLGDIIVVWLWGGYAVDNATLNRFFSLHFLFSFIIVALVLVHLLLLHSYGSNNPMGLGFFKDSKNIYPYYFVKDFYGVILFFIFFCIFLFFLPNVLGHTDNYIAANPLVTPSHIVPEWYFLPFYAILRSIPDKLFGVIALLMAIVVLLFLPFFIKPLVLSNKFRPVARKWFWILLLLCFVLGWIGNKPIEYPFMVIGQCATFLYFIYFFTILPFVLFFEKSAWYNYL